MLADAHGCDPALLNHAAGLEAMIRAALADAGCTLLNLHVATFEPQGITATACLAESHLTLHTWPEHGYAALDAFTCGDTDPVTICRGLADQLRADRLALTTHPRGIRAVTAAPTCEMTP